MSATNTTHPLFARVFARMSAKNEERGVAEWRAEALAGLEGRVVEVGAGNGLCFPHYPATVRKVVAIEPEPYLRGIAQDAAKRASVPVDVVDGAADALPGEEASFDAGVASLVLCSVPDQAVALTELFRVIRPGGELRFFEHVVSEDARQARRQRRADRWIWPRVAGGCHAGRDTVGAIEAAGFVVERQRRFPFQPAPLITITKPHVIGVARRP